MKLSKKDKLRAKIKLVSPPNFRSLSDSESQLADATTVGEETVSGAIWWPKIVPANTASMLFHFGLMLFQHFENICHPSYALIALESDDIDSNLPILFRLCTEQV